MTSTPQTDIAKGVNRAYSRTEVVDILRTVLGTVAKEPTTKLHKDLAALANYIEGMRSELAELRSAEIKQNHIPTATDELDAVVGETAKATGTIMDCCDKISNIAATLQPPNSDALTTAVTAIYEACSFQDITGQRINKVVKALKNIESKVSEIINAIGNAQPPGSAPAPTQPAIQKNPDNGLLNGPQLKGPATSQEEIDKLLASFDK